MDIAKALKGIGLNAKEVKVYTSLLQIGQSTATEIAKKSGLKRPTVYVILDQLKIRGIVSESKEKKTAVFAALEPEKLHTLYKEKEQSLKNALPALQALYNAQPHKPSVQIFEGLDGVNAVYFDCIEYLKPGGEVMTFSSLESVITDYKSALDAWVKNLKKLKKARARDILRDASEERAFAKMMKGANPNYEIRFAPKNLGNLNSEILIWGNKVAIVSGKKDIFATVVEDKRIAETFKTFFEMAWKASKPAK